MSMIQQQCKRGTWYFDLLALTIFMVLLFGLFLGSRPLSTPDEARYSEIPREMLVAHDFVTPHLNGVKYFEKPPLVYWIQAASIKLLHSERPQLANPKALAATPISEWVVRIPNALIALLGCLLLYTAGRKLFDRQTGLVAAMILSTSLLYFTLARMLTLDMSLSVFLSGSLLAFLVAVNTPPALSSRRRFIFYLMYSFSALALLTKGLIGIVFPAMIVGSWILLTQQWRLLKQMYLPTGILLFLLIALPWHLLVQLKNPEFFQFYFIDQQFLRYSTLISHRYQPMWFFIPICLVGFLPWIVFLFQAMLFNFPKTWQQITEKRKQVFLLLWIAIIFVFFSVSHSKLIPYILPIFPAIALLTGRYLVVHSHRTGVKCGTILLPCLLLTLGISGFFWLKQNPSIDLPTRSMPFLVAGYSILLLGSVLAAVYYVRQHTKTAFILLTLGSAISFIIFSTSIPYIDTRSIKPLVQTLKPLLQPQDKVVSFNHYYQDLPFYLNQRVLTVNVGGELSFGMQHQNTHAWMLEKAEFWPLWNSKQQIFMVTDKRHYQIFKKKHRTIYLLAATPQDVLLSNHPVPKRLIHSTPEDKQ